jgi:Flp pilus assembly protein TadD
MKAGRPKCLRCGEDLVPAEPPTELAPATAPATKLWLTGWRSRLAIAGAFLSLLLGLTLSGHAPAPVTTPVAQPSQSPVVSGSKTESHSSESEERGLFITADESGRAAYARGDFATALAEFQRAAEAHPDDPNLINNFAQGLVRVGRADEAIPHFERAIALNRSSWMLRFNLAHAHGVMNDWPKAVAGYREALTLFPDDYVTRYNLGLALHKNGQDNDAIPEFRKAIELAPGEASFHLSLGISYEKLNKPAEAAQAYDEYIAMQPSAPDAAQVRSRIERLKKASSGEAVMKPS